MPTWTFIPGILAQGYRVASGPSADYPYGALDRQRPIFLSRGLDLTGYFNGSLELYDRKDLKWGDRDWMNCQTDYRRRVTNGVPG